MESKSKVFTHKLIALFLAVIMAVTCFTGVITAYAKSTDDYHDNNLAANFLAWAEVTDEQTAEALLDYADLYIDDLIVGLMGNDHIYFSQNIVIDTIKIDAYLDSIDGILDTVRQGNEILSKYGGVVGGDVKNLNLSPLANLSYSTSSSVVTSKCGKSYRAANDAKDILMALAQTLYINSNDFAGKNVLGNFFKGTLNLGSIVTGIIGGDVYDLLQDALGMWSGYKTNLVYNIVANLIWQNTNWYTASEIDAFKTDFQNNGKAQTSWDFDTQLVTKLTTELIQKINVEITYTNEVDKINLDQSSDDYGKYVYYKEVTNTSGKKETKEVYYDHILTEAEEETEGVWKADMEKDSSARRWYYISTYMKNNDATYEQACEHYGYDSNLQYSMDDNGKSDGNICIFVYGDRKVDVTITDTFSDVAFKALEIAWTTAIDPTLTLLQANFNGNESTGSIQGSNFDNKFYDWVTENGTWNTENWVANYSDANVEAWAADVYTWYKDKDGNTLTSPEQFLQGVKDSFNYDRRVKEEAQYNWRDIPASSLFNELRYSPLADKYFEMQTGPINLYFAQTGANAIETFFETAFTDYDSIVEGINNGLVAAVYDLFPDSENIGLGDGKNNVVTDIQRPSLATIKTTDSQTIANTLVGNAVKVFEYAANCADENILAAYYHNHSISDVSESDNLSETVFEEACVPLLIAVLNEWNITDTIHDTDWDKCVDAEGVATVALAEYLSYVLPEKNYSVLWTEQDGVINATFEGTIMPMARDALGYILQAYVPCRHEVNGEWVEWNVYETDVNDDTEIWDILNSVACYYASQENFNNSEGFGSSTLPGKAVASLLGVVNSSGVCQFKLSNTIWQNIDNVANRIFPVLGTLQNGTKGGFDSYDLFYNKIISGILDIGPNHGITNILKQVVDIINSNPISVKDIDHAVYDDILADTINGLLGARYSGQGYTKIIPNSDYYSSDSSSYTKASSPFNALIHTDTLAYYSGSDSYETGIVGILICNIYEFFGGGNYSNNGTTGCWQGAMFAVKAVNNFIPSFVPQLSEHTIGMVTAKVSNPSQSNLTAGNAYSTTDLVITNNSMGLNRFYRNASGVNENDRYFAYINSVSVKDSDGNTPSSNNVTIGAYTRTVAPEEFVKVSISGKAPSGTKLYIFTIDYDIYMGKKGSTRGTSLYSNLQTRAYLYLTTNKDWRSTLYTWDYSTNPVVKGFDGTYETSSYNQSNAYTSSTVRGGTSNQIWTAFPNDFIVPMSNPHSIEELGFRGKNTTSSSFGSNRAFDGVYTYLTSGTEYYTISNNTVNSTITTASADNTGAAYAAIDRSTGDIINYDRVDKYYNGSWHRGTKSSDTTSYDGNSFNTKNLYQGYAASDTTGQNYSDYSTRPHVVYTFNEALAAGIVQGVQRTPAEMNADGTVKSYVYQSVMVTPNTLNLGANKISGYEQYGMSWGTPTPGIFLKAGKTTVEKGANIYSQFVAYDGTTALEADDYNMKVHVYTSNNNNMNATIHMHISDDSAANTLSSKYEGYMKEMGSYQASDFSDPTNFNKMQSSFENALATMSTSVNASNCDTLGSKTRIQGLTQETTAIAGDLAYKPVPVSVNIPASMQVDAVKGSEFWYWNKELTMPIYSNEALTDADVDSIQTLENGDKVGYDATGAAVIKQSGSSDWHLKNEIAYNYKWDTTTYSYPYLMKDTTDPKKNDADEQIYNQTQFVYRTATGEKTTSTSANAPWVYKLAESATVIVPNEETSSENRGVYQLAADNLDYWYETAKKDLVSDFAEDVHTQVTLDRENQQNENYEVVTYERMVTMAKEAEKLIWEEKNEDGDIVYNTDATSIEIAEAISVYNFYKGLVVPRGYIGDKLNEEIAHHTNGTGNYNSFIVTKVADSTHRFPYSIRDNSEVDDVDSYTVKVADGVEVEFGSVDAEGNLVNADAEGNKLYTDASWNAYVDALGAAVDVAKGQESLITETYSAKAHLITCENNLEEFVGEEPTEGFTVTGTVKVAKDEHGDSYAETSFVQNATINAVDQSGEIVATTTTANDGTFSLDVPSTAVSLKIVKYCVIERTITLSGEAVTDYPAIPVVAIDYNNSGGYDATDKGLFKSKYEADDADADLNGSGGADASDKGIFKLFNKDMDYTYSDFTL
ncbi:MAG: hypothetical protein IJS03_01705 [Eubacterium sp.]|nr:hypothetical protein [Eubacterium sp.]